MNSIVKLTCSVFLPTVMLCIVINAKLMAQGSDVKFISSDKKMEMAFVWAKEMALHYKGQATDPVGPWYESALPPRDAFCMRDVSHQSVGAEILGLNRENRNMLTLFAKNITASKNWCSYWEINKTGKPAPEDYRNDREFWYNLPANFDVLNACWRLYLWTGDKYYINNPVFVRFQQKTVNEYINTWILSADGLFNRPAHPNAPVPYNEKDSFHRCRGLPSYVESVPNLKSGADLVAALYRGLITYAAILKEKGRSKEAASYLSKAEKYRQQLETKWWDEKDKLYNTYYSNDGHFGKEEGETFLLWFDALNDTARVNRTLAHLNSKIYNVENTSYLPLIFYNKGSWIKARDYILYLADEKTARREYPEVSFGIIEGVIQGLMGIKPNASTQRVSTIYKASNGSSSSVHNLPILHTVVDVSHLSSHQSSLKNQGKQPLIWRAMFYGKYHQAWANQKAISIKRETDEEGRSVSVAEVVVKAGQQITVSTNN